MTGSSEYSSFADAKSRCENKNHHAWPDYGGRGIRFLFSSIQQLIAEIGLRPEGLTLDRIDNDGHYEPGNVRWATRSQQLMNQRRCKNKLPKSVQAHNFYIRKREILRSLSVHYTQAEWEALKEMWGNTCLCCHEKKPLTPDHVIPLCDGGLDSIDNIQPLCRSCNSRKWRRHTDYRLAHAS